MEVLEQEGFKTRQQARRDFFERARLLYDFNCELDQCTVVQSLIMMSLACDRVSGHRDASYWADVAISEALRAKLHLDLAYISPCYPIDVQRLRRRIWWCCCILDNLASLATDHTPKISEGDFDVLMLEETDFHPLTDVYGNTRYHSCDDRTRHDEQINAKDLAQVCIFQATLWTVGKRNPQISTSDDNRLYDILSQSTPVAGQLFTWLDRSLVQWYDSLPSSIRDSAIPSSDGHNRRNMAILLSQAFLRMVYHMTILKACQSRLKNLVETEITSFFEIDFCQLLADSSAKHIIQTIAAVDDKGVGRFLPPMSRSFALLAANFKASATLKQSH
ncbi:unnamed protein product [Clonostachys byssicola]|uniref:Xylanolytic transcriptional activator regulatory domain-containing protein n=1 Tax=Clonostachys byssicola TaxID=160290 RepID=A0A9N9U5Q5_9HYPO|nr:unnamed protein product [Clonostachys byssicola]